MVHLLLKRNPTIFYQHFIEGIFHFTSYEKHESFNRFPQSERSVPRRGWHGGPGGVGVGSLPARHASPLVCSPGERGPSAWPRGCAETVLLCPREKRLFSLKGGKNRERRMRIYKFLLEHFTDEQRFNITSRIFENVLGRTGQSGDKACGGNCCVAGGPAALQPRGPNAPTRVSLAVGPTFRPRRPPPRRPDPDSLAAGPALGLAGHCLHTCPAPPPRPWAAVLRVCLCFLQPASLMATCP